MNFQMNQFLPPLRVMLINPLSSASQLTITKILSGAIFGKTQFIDLILLVYSNETDQAQELALELTGCAFQCTNTIKVTSDIPCLTDADVFCFMTNFANPNSFDFENMDSNEQFDNVYLIIQIALSFAKSLLNKEPSDPKQKTEEKSKQQSKEPQKPIIIADGLLAIEILMIIGKKLPPEIMYFNTPLRSIAKITLSDFLKVKCSEINIPYVWAANDVIFYTDFELPYLKNDTVHRESKCEWDAVSREMLDKLNLGHTHFNATWMKKDFMDMMVQASSTNPYGCIFKSAEMAKTLHSIWKPRFDGTDFKISVGVISDGSLGTIRGLPYVLPLIITKNSWTVNQIHEETSHLRQEIKRINAAALEHHKKLVPYIKKFLKENVIQLDFVPKSISDSGTSYSSSSVEQNTTSTVKTEDD